MGRIQLVHWKAEEAEERAERLRGLGYEVSCRMPAGAPFLRALAEDPPLGVVIDLSRLPSQGRDLGVMLRNRKSTRQIPLVFVGGRPDKVARIQELLPDATYATWDEVGVAIERAIAHPPQDPVVPGSAFAAYRGKPLPDKLGIKAGMTVSLLGAPAEFAQVLGSLPEGVTLREDTGEGGDLILWFTHSGDELEEGIEGMAARLERGAVWIAWPKKASGVISDLTQQRVRKTGLAAGLVDYKICSIDKTWSALLFTRRKR